MSKIHYQAKVTLSNATPTQVNDQWELTLVFSDLEGVSNPLSITPGDVVVLDTSSYETGTLSRYEILSVIKPDFKEPIVLAKFQESNTNAMPDLTWVVGTIGIIARPSTNYGLLPVTAPSVQQMTDRLSFYVLNYNLVSLMDGILTQGLNTVYSLYTATRVPYLGDGRAALPNTPIGDFILNMAILHFEEGYSMEVTDVIHEMDVNGVSHVVIPPEDLPNLPGNIISLTVSYMVQG